MAVSLTLSNPRWVGTYTGYGQFDWKISGLSFNFNQDNYQRVGVTSESFSDGASSLPGIIYGQVNAPDTGTDRSVSSSSVGVTSGLKLVYGFAQAYNGKYYTADSGSITIPNPPPTTYPVSVTIGTGQMANNPTGGDSYEPGVTVTVGCTITDSNYIFLYWLDVSHTPRIASYSQTYSFTMPAKPVYLVAYTTELVYYKVTLEKSAGIDTVSGAGDYFYDNIVSLNATLKANSVFNGWYRKEGTEYIFVSSSSYYQFRMPSGDRTYRARSRYAGGYWTEFAYIYSGANIPFIGGVAYPMTASLWNSFTSYVNGLLTYNGKATYSFTEVFPDGDFSAAIINEAIAAINTLENTLTPVVPKVTNVNAAIFKAMVDVLDKYVISL